MQHKGLVQVYTGCGKGKTTAALGLSFRAVGQGLRVLFVQFMKGGQVTGEAAAVKAFPKHFVLERYGSGRFNKGRQPTEEELALAEEAAKRVEGALERGGFDIIVLDEISHALNCRLISTNRVCTWIQDKPDSVELVLTGRNMPKIITDAANLVSRIAAEKHPFDQGIGSRKGIEY